MLLLTFLIETVAYLNLESRILIETLDHASHSIVIVESVRKPKPGRKSCPTHLDSSLALLGQNGETPR